MRLDERLKSLRKGEGITQKELAEAINVSIQSIWNLKSDKKF